MDPEVRFQRPQSSYLNIFNELQENWFNKWTENLNREMEAKKQNIFRCTSDMLITANYRSHS